MEIVAFAGPPLVKFIVSSKSWRVPFVDMIVVKRIIGFNMGTVILKNLVMEFAPSITAASKMERSMFCKAAR